MLHFGRHMRKFSRLLIGLLAVQFFAAGFCLIAPIAHAADMPMSSSMQSQVSSSQALSSQSTLNFDAACDKAAMAESRHVDHEMVTCAHCDLPNELISNSVSSFNIDMPVVLLSSSVDVPVSNRIDLSLSLSTGPPLVSPLLYHTNQRILI